MIVRDTWADPRFVDHPETRGDDPIRFYAGVPLTIDEGSALGMLCVVDKVPRQLTPAQIAGLKTLARHVSRELRLRREAARSRVSMAEGALRKGEVLGGMILGWNFGDGHLNDERLLRAIQPQCGFEPGEVRVVSVEGQPLFGPSMHWKVVDAASGLVAAGDTTIARMKALQPWPTGEYAEALLRRRRATA